jgi:hypothetical protein
MNMEPVTILLSLGIIIGTAAGFGAGWGLKPDDTQEALEAQAKTLTDLSAGQRQIAEAAARPVVIDAELRSTLAEVPVQCREEVGGDPMSAACQWATCLQYGQSSAQRPECREVEALMVAMLKAESCPEE